MSWIKRNLFFVIGAVVALGLMVGAGFYTWTGWNHNAKALEDLNQKYADLKALIDKVPSPGDKKVNNIEIAKQQTHRVREVLAQGGKQFERIAPIPDEPNLTDKAFASSLSRIIARLQLDATNASVALPPKYNFSFEAQSGSLRFERGSLEPLAVQLGEVKALCDVLIAAKVNWLDSIQRERVSADDVRGSQVDYIDLHTQTNELALLTPYQLTFRCFTPELAQVLCGFAGSSHGIIVKSLNVEPAAAATALAMESPASAPYAPPPIAPAPVPVTPTPRYGEDDAFARRYGTPRPAAPTPAPVYAPPTATAPAARTQPVLLEKQIKVTMLVQIVKLLPKK
jgi:hypothetical protein